MQHTDDFDMFIGPEELQCDNPTDEDYLMMEDDRGTDDEDDMNGDEWIYHMDMLGLLDDHGNYLGD